MMMRYPVSAGPLSEGVLDDMFRVIRKVSSFNSFESVQLFVTAQGTALVDKDCNLGASVTSYSNSASGNNSPIDMSAPRSRVSTLVSKFEGTDGGKGDMQASGNGYRHFSAFRSSSLSGSSGSSTEVTKGFYCKSAPAYGCKYLNKQFCAAMLSITFFICVSHVRAFSHVFWDCPVYSTLKNDFNVLVAGASWG